MKIYLTKVWGFGEPAGPLQFSERGWRERARNDLKPDDLVVLVGTTNEPTIESERGRLLGLMEPTKERVSTLDFKFDYYPHDYDEDGNYKWPHSLLNFHAWRLIDRPFLSEISERSFAGYDAVKGIVPLNDLEVDRVMALRREAIQLLTPGVRALERIGGTASARKRTSPPPSTTRRGVMHMRRSSAYTYAMQIERESKVVAYKIGWAFDYKKRAQQFNHASMPELRGLKYSTIRFHLWDTAREAFHMEQLLLDHFKNSRHISNHEILHDITERQLDKIWNEMIFELSKKPRIRVQ